MGAQGTKVLVVNTTQLRVRYQTTEESRVTWRMKASRRSESGIGPIEILSDPVGSDFESPCLPVVAVEHLNGSCSIFSCGEENGAVSSRSVVWP